MRTEIAIISALALVLSMPLVFAQTDGTSATSATSATGIIPETITIDNPYQKPNNLYSETIDSYTVQNPDGTHTMTTHFPYFEDENGNFMPYRINEDSSMIQVEVNGGKFVFDKNQGALTIFDETETVIDSDSYVVRQAQLNTDNWNNLQINNEVIETQLIQDGNIVTVSFIQEDETGLFKVEYIIKGGTLKTTAYFTNYSFEDSKFAFTETINLPDSIISLNDMEDIDLTNFVGQSFPREVLEENQDLILQIKDMYYNSGLGFENLWNVSIVENNKIALDYANVSETHTAIGETVELDPTFGYTSTTGYIAYMSNNGASASCSTVGNQFGQWMGRVWIAKSSGGYTTSCANGVFEWNISSIPSNNIVTDTSIKYGISSSSGMTTDCNWNSVNGVQPSTLSNSGANAKTVFDAVNNGNTFVTDSSCKTTGSGKVVDLGTIADSDIQSDITNGTGYWVLGMTGNSMARQTYDQWANISSMELQVTYNLPPNSPTGVTATQNTTTNYNTVDLSWIQGSGSTPTSYEIFRGGSSIGTVTASTNSGGNSWDLNTDNYIDFNNNVSLSGDTTVGMWVKFPLAQTTYDGFSFAGSSQNGIFFFSRGSNPSYQPYEIGYYDHGGNMRSTGYQITNISSGWHYMTLTSDWTNTETKVWVDGVQVGNTINQVASNHGAITSFGRINQAFNTIDDPAIWNTVLTQSEIQSLATGSSPNNVQGNNLLIYYDLEQSGNATNQATGSASLGSNYYGTQQGTITTGQSSYSVQGLPNTNFIDTNAPDSSNLSYTISATNTAGTSAQSTAGLVETFYTPNQVVNVTDQGAASPLVIDWDVPTVPSVTNSVTTTVSGGNAWDFYNNHVSLGAINTFGTMSTGTISAWIKTDNPSGTNTVFSASDSGDPSSEFVFGNALNGVYVLNRENGTLYLQQYPTTVTTGWHHIAITFDSTGTDLFLDGTLLGSYSAQASPSRTNNIDSILIGCNKDSGGFQWCFDGKMDDVGIWNTVLSSQNIQSLSNGNSVNTVSTNNILAYYDFEDTGNTLTNQATGISSLGSLANGTNSGATTQQTSYSIPTTSTVTTQSPSVSGYQIERDDGSGFNVIEANHGTNQYSDSTASGNVVYKISGINAVGTGTASANHNGTAGTPPDAPTGLTSSIQDVNTNPLNVVLNWSSPTNVGTGTLQGFEVWRNGSLITTTGLVTTYTDTVTAGTHSYYLKAVSNHGTSIASNTTNITTPTVPSSPQNASSVISDINTPYDVTVTWETPSSTGGSDLTQYNVYRKQGSGTYSLLTTTTGLSITDTVPSLLSTNFTYKIHSVNNVGESTAFTDTTITTFDVPQAPTLSVTTGTTVLSWNTPTSDAVITNYKIYRDGSLLTTVGTVNTHTDFTTIVFGNSYDYKIVAVSSLGDSADSNTVNTTPETEITGMTALGVTGTGAVIDWEEPAYYQGQVTSYNVYYGNSGTPTTSAGTTTNTYNNFAPQLDYDTTYVFAVSINSPLGNSGLSNIVAITTSVDGSIVAYDPNTGTMDWFDIDSVSEQTVNVIEFQRETQNLNVNGTFTDVDTLQVGYPSWWDNMTCDVDYKFAQKTEQYVEGNDMFAVINTSDANQQVIGFEFHDIDNEVIEVECAPQQSTQDDGVSAKYIMTQQNLSTGAPNIPLVTQIQAFQTGDYGTDGEFSGLDIVGLFVILISMVGFNRLNPIVGVLLSASLVFGLSFFGIISLPTVLVGVIALVIFLAWGITRNR